MFLTRFLLVASLCIATPLTALAVVDERPKNMCVAGTKGEDKPANGKSAGVYNNKNGQGINSHYIVYFDNDNPKIADDCKTKVANMAKAIKEIEETGVLDSILLFGTADNTGKTDNNVTLAQGRLNAVQKALKDAGVLDNLYACTEDKDGVCAQFATGDQPWEKGSRYQARAVYIFLIYNENVAAAVDICGDTFRGVQDGVTQKLREYGDAAATAKVKWDEVIEFCGGGKERASQEDINDFESMMADFLNSLPDRDGIRDEIKNELSEVTLELKIAQANLEYRNLTTGQASVWKTAAGKFNYHRLIADLSAGVVLGTGGGLLSSHLIKKAQVKEGFEDLQCTIGGQLVGNWGDQFLPTMTVAP